MSDSSSFATQPASLASEKPSSFQSLTRCMLGVFGLSVLAPSLQLARLESSAVILVGLELPCSAPGFSAPGRSGQAPRYRRNCSLRSLAFLGTRANLVLAPSFRSFPAFPSAAPACPQSFGQAGPAAGKARSRTENSAQRTKRDPKRSTTRAGGCPAWRSP